LKKTLSLVIAMLCTMPLWAQQKDSTDTQKIFAAYFRTPGTLLKHFNKGFITSAETELLARPILGDGEKGGQDSLVLTEQEKKFIKSSLKKTKRFSWSKKEMAANGLSMHALADKQPLPDPNNPGAHHYVYQIAKPVFLRNNTICVLIYQYNCGPLCGEGACYILKKESAGWIKWGSLVRWVS